MPRMKSFPVILTSLAWIIPLLHEANGLQCYTCYPCNDNEPGDLQTCDDAAYANLPDKGYQSCMDELGAGGTRRKGCRWLRNDPDDNSPVPNPRPLRCVTSPLDDVSTDCYCFTDKCNEKALQPPVTDGPIIIGPGPDGSKEVGKGGYNSSTKTLPNLENLLTVLVIMVGSVYSGFC